MSTWPKDSTDSPATSKSSHSARSRRSRCTQHTSLLSSHATHSTAQDGDFYLWESVAILRYLIAKFPCKPHWYPTDLCMRARIDAALCWHFNNTRQGSMQLCWNRYIKAGSNTSPVIITHLNRAIAPARGLPVNAAVADAAETLLQGALTDLERVWLADGRWLCGASQPTIADLLIVCELEQLRLLDGATKVLMSD